MDFGEAGEGVARLSSLWLRDTSHETRVATDNFLGFMNERPWFENLEVWKLAHEITLLAYRLTKDFPADERYRLIDQMCRAAASIPANIAEGEGREHVKDKIHFLHIARGSLSELRYFMLLSRDLNYINNDQETAFNDLAAKLHAKLYAYIKSKERNHV